MKKGQAAGATDFESSLGALERIVRELERGELPLEQSLALFEQGVRLSRECQDRLNEAERRIEVLLRDAEGRPVVNELRDESDEFANSAVDNVATEDESVF